MATSGAMVPYSNPAGNNQTTPKAVLPPSSVGSQNTVPVNNPLQPTQTATVNPFIPPAAGTGAGTTQVPGAATVASPGAAGSDPNGALYQQLTDIYGNGEGAALNNLLGSIGGVDSATLQQYIASLQPQFAKAGASLQSSLGAAGVSANSSVNAIGQANLQGEEQSAIAGESAKLLQSGQNLEAQILEGIAPTAAQQVADSSPLNMIGSILGDVGSVASDFLGLGSITGGIGKLASSFGGAAGAVPSATLNTTVPEPDFSLSL
ncbi:MAG: hypothetical protein P4L77_12010 [Sulfuriferula sp.]|nr:hypothetical protein [Sulfuriferula sp.]